MAGTTKKAEAAEAVRGNLETVSVDFSREALISLVDLLNASSDLTGYTFEVDEYAPGKASLVAGAK